MLLTPALQSLVGARNMGPEATNSAKPNSCSAISTLSHPSQTIRHISWPPAPKFPSKFTSARSLEPKKIQTHPRCQNECNATVQMTEECFHLPLTKKYLITVSELFENVSSLKSVQLDYPLRKSMTFPQMN